MKPTEGFILAFETGDSWSSTNESTDGEVLRILEQDGRPVESTRPFKYFQTRPSCLPWTHEPR